MPHALVEDGCLEGSKVARSQPVDGLNRCRGDWVLKEERGAKPWEGGGWGGEGWRISKVYHLV